MQVKESDIVLRRLVIIVSVGGVLLVLACLYGPAASQRRGLRTAHELMEHVAPAIAGDSRFNNILIRTSTHPALFIHGEVPDEKSLADLQSLIRLPPDAEFRLIWSVKVAEAGATKAGDSTTRSD